MTADTKTTKPDVLLRLKDLHKQATVERSHFYVGSVVHEAIDEIERLRFEIDMHERAKKLFHRLRAIQMQKGKADA